MLLLRFLLTCYVIGSTLKLVLKGGNYKGGIRLAVVMQSQMVDIIFYDITPGVLPIGVTDHKENNKVLSDQLNEPQNAVYSCRRPTSCLTGLLRRKGVTG